MVTINSKFIIVTIIFYSSHLIFSSKISLILEKILLPKNDGNSRNFLCALNGDGRELTNSSFFTI